MKRIFGNKILFCSMISVSSVAGNISALETGSPVNVSPVTVEITSCLPAMLGALQAVTYTVTFPSPVTSCIGAVDVTLFLTNLTSFLASNANSVYTQIITDPVYTTTTYLAPLQPCNGPGNMCATGVVFSCYEPSTSTIFLGGDGTTC